MFDWLHVLARRLGRFIMHVPLYVAGPAMILIGALDSSLLSLPEINDYLVIARCYTHPRTVFIFPLFPAIGSVLGCLLLYTILRRGGRAVLHRRFRMDHVLRVERAYARFGILALAIPAFRAVRHRRPRFPACRSPRMRKCGRHKHRAHRTAPLGRLQLSALPRASLCRSLSDLRHRQ